MNAKHNTKIVWFTLRTGCNEAEAQKWLKEAKHKIDVAIRLRRDHHHRRLCQNS